MHLDIASDYSTEAFLAAFRRFVLRRGLCKAMYSDRGTNFIGADRQLRSFFQNALGEGSIVTKSFARESVRWRFNPPAAPHGRSVGGRPSR